MSENTNILTRKNYDKLKSELEQLTQVELPKAFEELNFARSQGDLSENSDYDAAKEKTESIKARISTLQYQIDHAKIVDGAIDKNVVSVGSKVKAENVETGKIYEFSIVGASAANPMNMEISNASPVGEAVLQHKVGDVVEVNSPRPYSLKILEIFEESK